tara:strand:- start:701 stop:940 length:240 start_codon:yes stop_codon:yes gene_type:complete
MDISMQIELASEISEKIVIENNPQSVIYKYNEYGDECGYLDEIQDQFNEVYNIVLESIRSHWRWDYRKDKDGIVRMKRL